MPCVRRPRLLELQRLQQSMCVHAGSCDLPTLLGADCVSCRSEMPCAWSCRPPRRLSSQPAWYAQLQNACLLQQQFCM